MEMEFRFGCGGYARNLFTLTQNYVQSLVVLEMGKDRVNIKSAINVSFAINRICFSLL